MANREQALQIADNAIEQIEKDTQELLNYAIVLLLADISETLNRMHEYLTGMDAIKGV